MHPCTVYFGQALLKRWKENTQQFFLVHVLRLLVGKFVDVKPKFFFKKNNFQENISICGYLTCIENMSENEVNRSVDETEKVFRRLSCKMNNIFQNIPFRMNEYNNKKKQKQQHHCTITAQHRQQYSNSRFNGYG